MKKLIEMFLRLFLDKYDRAELDYHKSQMRYEKYWPVMVDTVLRKKKLRKG